ncbi:FtsX-like permease family protein [Streptomyces sp. NPDC059909]|uniref:FtsX-like permease family protein n=1 Tax=Streptomyces sp. NPDC059909 TaxID=3346998 RepID=UPI00365B7036
MYTCYEPVAWTLPATARQVASRPDPTGLRRSGILATTGAAPKGLDTSQYASIYVQLDPSVPEAIERARTAVFRADPMLTPFHRPARLQPEQLRERKELLSALVAFGTRRSTLSMSVLWQTTVPIALGLPLSTAVGLALGAVLLKMVAARVAVDWGSVAAMAGVGAGVVLLVTLLSLPPLWRLMRPEGLRTE